MTKVQIEKIKEVCGQVSKLCYTAKYKVDKFKVTEVEEIKDIRIDFAIKRQEKMNNESYYIFYYGTVYISSKGKVYRLNEMKNKISYKYIAQAIYKEEQVKE